LSEFVPVKSSNPRQNPKDQKVVKRSLALIFFVILMDIVGMTLLSPVAPRLVLRYSNSAVMVTLVTVLYAAGQFVAAPFLGKVSDKIGRRPVILISLIGQAAGYLVFGLGGALWVLLLGRLIGGITSGNLSTSNAYIADVSKPEERSKNFALISTAWSLGLILGPALGGLFGQIGLEAPAYVAGGISFLNAVIGFFLLPESLSQERRDHTPVHLRDLNPVVSIFQIGRKPGLLLLLLANALFSFAFNGISSISALFVIQKFSAVTWQVSFLMISAGIAIALSNSILVPRWIPRFGERLAGTGGLLGIAVASATIFFVPLLWLVYLFNMLYAMMSSFVFPSLVTLSVEQVTQQEVGRLLGVTSAVGSLMGIFGPLWAGLIYDHVMTGSPYWMGPIFFVIAALILFRTPAREKSSLLVPETVNE
jgi:MFS transporter, DHA1 family, tetracycline resistance protein